jgi:hypothetical protein
MESSSVFAAITIFRNLNDAILPNKDPQVEDEELHDEMD